MRPRANIGSRGHLALYRDIAISLGENRAKKRRRKKELTSADKCILFTTHNTV